MLDFTAKPALLLIDIQTGFDQTGYWGGHRNNPEAEANSGRLLEVWRALQLPLFHVKHNSTNPQSPLHPDRPGNAIQAIVAPLADEVVIPKSVNSAFIGTPLETILREKGITQVVIVGLITDHCVSTTARMAGNLGFATFVVEDATATFDRVGPDGTRYSAEVLHAVHLASLSEEFARIMITKEVIAAISLIES